MEFDLVDFMFRQKGWSEKTFGPGRRTLAILDHIQKEIGEVRENPTDLEEWVDIVLIALDGAWRSGHTPHQIVSAMTYKQEKNMKREYPDWREYTEDVAIEHVRGIQD